KGFLKACSCGRVARSTSPFKLLPPGAALVADEIRAGQSSQPAGASSSLIVRRKKSSRSCYRRYRGWAVFAARDSF
ncbi:unnamed protein product, partial [Ectocarpus sp. 12 AP-2014]